MCVLFVYVAVVVDKTQWGNEYVRTTNRQFNASYDDLMMLEQSHTPLPFYPFPLAKCRRLFFCTKALLRHFKKLLCVCMYVCVRASKCGGENRIQQITSFSAAFFSSEITLLFSSFTSLYTKGVDLFYTYFTATAATIIYVPLE